MNLNILRPAVLRQYFGTDIEEDGDEVKRYTYGSGLGSSSVGMDPLNYVTRPWNAHMLAMSTEIQEILHSNRKLFNLDKCNIITRFNHITILIYYSGRGLKNISSLGYHTDCVYSSLNGKFDSKQNSQVENTPAVIYSIGHNRSLHWKVRKLEYSKDGKKRWQTSSSYKRSFQLGSDTITVIHPDDENPLSTKNSEEMKQYVHGGVNVSGEKFSVGFVFRVVDRIGRYHKKDDTMVVENKTNNVVNGILGLDIGAFHTNLLRVYCNTLN